MGELVIKEVLTKKDRRDFIYLPEKVHKDEPDWLPPIYMDEWELYDKKKNKSYQYADALLLLAYRDNKPVGRIMGLLITGIIPLIMNSMDGSVSWSAIMTKKYFMLLLPRVEDWARQNGMTKIVGPLGFSDKDPQGFQIEGFEYPQFMTSCQTILHICLNLLRQKDMKKRLIL